MPQKRGRSAFDTLVQTSGASLSSFANTGMLETSSLSSSTASSSSKPTKSLRKHISTFFSAFSPSRKRQKTSSPADLYGPLRLASSTPMTSDTASPSSTAASGFLDLTPSKVLPSTASATKQDASVLLALQEGAIRDPLGRTCLDSSPSIASAVITDPATSLEEAAEQQIQYASPSPSATITTKPTNLASVSETTGTTAPDQVPVQDEMPIADSQYEQPAENDAASSNQPVPTDADLDKIQVAATAEAGERVEGLLDWSRSLNREESHPSSAQVSHAAQDAALPSEVEMDAAATEQNAAAIVDLVSDSEDGDSAAEDPDKENDISLVNSTPRLNSDVALASLASQNRLAELSNPVQSRKSLAGPMAHKSWREYRQATQAKSRTDSEPADNSFELIDTSATETIRSIGRQSHFVQPSRRSVPQNSTPLPLERPHGRDRSSSFSSNLSNLSLSASSSMALDSAYRKRAPIYEKQHLQVVGRHNRLSVKRNIERALERINQVRLSRRKPLLPSKQFYELAAKARKVHKIVAEDNAKMASQTDFLDQLTQKFLRQRQRDAETAVLPLPRAKLLEAERLKREQRAKLRRLRGILGRKQLPDTLGPEREEAATCVFSKRGVVSEITGAGVSDTDVQKLRPKQWLNDEVINFYGALILNRANEAEKKRMEAMAALKDAPAEPRISHKAIGKGDKSQCKRPYDESLDAFWRVHFFSSFFWTNLKNKGFDGVKRWTRRIDIFSKDIILFPINLGNRHWVCGAINMRKHRFEYYDSLGTPNRSAFTLMRTYLIEEARDKKNKEIDLRGWTDLFSDDSPQQENGYDCGVFAAQTLEQISRRDPHTRIPLDAPRIAWIGESLDEGAGKLSLGAQADDTDEDDEYEWNFGQQNMPYLRRRMAYEIYSKQLLD